jgi:hypothetical protein
LSGDKNIIISGGNQIVIEENKFVERYVSVWNESDESSRRKVIAELWNRDGIHFAKGIEARGYDEIEKRIASAHDEFVRKGSYIFVRANLSKSLQNAVVYSWDMLPSQGGEAVASGIVFLILNDNGRIRTEYQF